MDPLEIQHLSRTDSAWRRLVREHGGTEALLSFLNRDHPEQKTPRCSPRGPLGLSGHTYTRNTPMLNLISAPPEGGRGPARSPPPLEEMLREGRFTVSPALAARILTEANYERQRPIAKHHVAFLADEMRRGCFLGGTQIAFASLAGRLVMVNGQHRLNAQALSNEAVEYQIIVQPALSADDLHRLYYRFDRGGRHRSDAEVIAAAEIVHKHGISATLARSVFQAQPLILNRFLRPTMWDPTLRNDDLRFDACKPWWPVAAEYEKLIAAASNFVTKKLKSSQAVAVALVTIKHQPEKAAVFWGGLAKDDGLRRNDPRKALLIDFSNREWGRKSSDGAVVTSLAWNAFYSNRALSQVKIVNGAAVRILGTPYDGRR